MAPHQLRCKQSLILCHFYIFYNRILQEQDVKCIFLKLSEANMKIRPKLMRVIDKYSNEFT
jgi:hypothetical protein